MSVLWCILAYHATDIFRVTPIFALINADKRCIPEGVPQYFGDHLQYFGKQGARERSQGGVVDMRPGRTPFPSSGKTA